MAPDNTSFEVFFDLVPTGAVLYAPIVDATSEVVDFAFVRLNPAAQRLLNLPAQPTTTLRQQYPHSVPTGIFAQYRAAYLTGQPSTYDVPYEGDGLDTFFRLVAQRSGELLVVNFTDLADLPRSGFEQSQSLRESRAREQAARAEAEAERQRFYDVLLQLPASVAVYRGPAHVYELVNPHYQQLFQNRCLLGRPIREALPELQGQGIIEQFDQVYATGQAYYEWEQEVWVDVTGTGRPERRYYNVLLQPLRDARNRVDGLLNFAYDVTELVEARRQQRQFNQELEARVEERTRQFQAAQLATETQRAELQRIFEQAPVAIAVFRGPQHTIELANSLQLAIWDRTREEALGKGLFELLPEVAAQGFEQILNGVMATGQPYVGVNAPARFTRHGVREEIFVSFVHHPLREADGRISGVVAVILDTTEQVRTRQLVEAGQAQVEQLNKELTATNRELLEANTLLTRTNVDLDTFVYTASHDLKAPIANIESLLLALRGQLPPAVLQDDVVGHLMTMFDSTVARFQVTIAQLTDLTKLHLTHAGPAEPVPLAAVIENVRLDLAPATLAADARLTVDVPDDLLVSFSPKNLRSVVYNLLSNAIKYRAPDRPAEVQLRAERHPGAVVLVVQDNGLGLTVAQQSRLFGIFQRLHTHVEGAGIGLYTIKRLIENAGGTIAVQSEVGVGTTFTVTFLA